MKKLLVILALFFCANTYAQKTPTCVPDSNGNYNDKITTESGGDEDVEMWGRGGGCIFRPIREVWGVLHNQPYMKWESEDEITVDKLTPPADSTHLYRIVYKVIRAFITVNWTMDWKHKVLEGTLQEPQTVAIEYRKIAGTSFIPIWYGSYRLRQVTPDITEFYMDNHLKARDTTVEDMKHTVRQVTEKLRKGEPNWGPLR